ncbi:uncharacterized protein LOC134538629 [Bacillus rossius redtenbacheri]|uniref:uncharacterized protein LOC134538629 n=1 Tax=Bacillus rossius redtenbacheri TaxID=93214 RepID=UPI002FDEC50E
MAAKFVLLLASAALFAACCGASVRDYVNCKSQPGDLLLYQDSVYKSSKYLQKVTQELALSTGNAVIHCITVINSKPSTPAADVNILGGGVGFNYVQLQFVSQRSHGIHYNVSVAGK